MEYKSDNIFLKKLTRGLTKEVPSKERYILSSDFETIAINGIHYVYAIGVLRKSNNYKDFFVKSYENIILESNNILKNYMTYLLSSIKRTKKVYIYFHNLGLFDGYFLVNHLLNNKELYNDVDLNILTRDNKIYKITYLNLTFLDSYNIIPFKLDDIGKILFDRGKTLDIKKYNTIKSIKTNQINISKYLYNDCKILYQSIIKFFKICVLYNTDITTNFTISSIAFKIYRFYYLEDSYEIMRSTFKNFIFLKKGYQGGINNVLVPVIKNGYCYDVNSLYPYIMQNCYMPLGKCTVITTNFKKLQCYFGFIECELYIKKDIEIPPLLLKLNMKENVQFKGYLKGVWFSEELKFAESVGVIIIKIHKVLNFHKKGIIFDGYVKTFYKKRLEAVNPVEKVFYKLLLNNLYGRFGMSLDHNFVLKIKDEDSLAYDLSYNFKEKINGTKNWYKVSNNYYLFNNLENKIKNIEDIDLREKVKKFWKKQERDYASANIAVQIAASIASYSRIKLFKDMYSHIINNNATINYYDTDSIFTDKKMSKSFIDDTVIGKYKLVSKIKEGYFIAPKVYSYIDYNNKITIKFKGFKDISNKTSLTFNSFKEIYNSIDKFESGELVLSYTLNLLNKNFKEFNIKNEEMNYQPSFITKKYIKVYKNNKWVKNRFPYIELPILLIIRLVFFNIFKYIINNKINYLIAIRNIFYNK